MNIETVKTAPPSLLYIMILAGAAIHIALSKPAAASAALICIEGSVGGGGIPRALWEIYSERNKSHIHVEIIHTPPASSEST